VWTRGGEWCAYVEAYTPGAAVQFVRRVVELEAAREKAVADASGEDAATDALAAFYASPLGAEYRKLVGRGG
jgi:hypothetical protein